MKTRNYIIAMLSLILVSMMILFSCEKENDVIPMNQTNASASIELPAEVAAYLTKNEIDEFYGEIDAYIGLPSRFRLQPVAIVMFNDVQYIHKKALPYPVQLKLTGKGIWENLSKIQYEETIDLLDNPSSAIGKGFILLSRSNIEKADPVYKNRLDFESSQREEMEWEDIYFGKNLVSKQIPGKGIKIRSRLDFKGGEGTFDEAYGAVIKLEYYDSYNPNLCRTVIYGFVAVKKYQHTD